MKSLLSRLHKEYPGIAFVKGNTFSWSPRDNRVTYDSAPIQPEIARWSLLHEVSHALLEHREYRSDFELMELEVAAWQHAKKLANSFGEKINAEHIQDCLDTYRDWLYRRSSCPTCTTVSIQKDRRTYECFNCKTVWQVSSSRFCRPYRRVTGA